MHRARDRSDRLLDFFVAVPGRGAKRPPKPHMESIDIDFDATSQVVYLIGAGSCAVPGAVAGLEAAHERYGLPPLEPAARACDRLGPRGRGADPAAGVPARDPRPHPPPRARGPARSTASTAAQARGERVVMHDLASTLELLAEGGAARALRRRARPRARALPRRERRPDHAATTSPRTGSSGGGRSASRTSGARVRVEPASVVGRDPDRLRALAPRPARGRRRARQRRGDRARSSRSCASSRGRGAGASSATSIAAGLPQALLGREHPGRAASGSRSASAGRRRDCAVRRERRTSRSSTSAETPRRSPPRPAPGSGVIVPGHRHPHEQHARRVRPRTRPGTACTPGRAADEHDGAVDRARRRRPAARRRQRGLGQAPRRDPPDRRQRRRSRAAGRRGDRGAAHPLRRAAKCTARAAPTPPSSTGSRRAATTSSAGAGGTSTSAAPQRSSAVPTARLAAAGDPRRGGHGIVVPA